jgi:uncharacterized protein YdhG (YjbR/CyaY superfamily)
MVVAHSSGGPMPTPTTVDEYLATLPDDRRGVMEEFRRTVTAAAPEATETLAYRMPALRSHGGQFLISYDAYKAHYSLFPASDAVIDRLGDALAPYLAGKGTIRFPASRPLPLDLIRRIVEIRVEENAARAGR